ncbi:MAG: hypothetical protein BGO58_10765 [Sphingopyxis sp. 65-8]|nr:hypothetical protein [Sphingopyxis terrae]OJW20029.1 MAG: hypothetical protein BGO58_10765 [Sphingopyxis sp. 65-8]
MAFAAFLAGLAAVMLLAPDTPAARWLHRHCVEELLDLAGRLERKHILFLVVGLVSIQAFAMTLPAELAVAMAWDVTAYVDLVIAGWTLSAFARVRSMKAWVGMKVRASLLRLHRRRVRARRVRRPVESRGAANDDDPAPARVALAA